MLENEELVRLDEFSNTIAPVIVKYQLRKFLTNILKWLYTLYSYKANNFMQLSGRRFSCESHFQHTHTNAVVTVKIWIKIFVRKHSLKIVRFTHNYSHYKTY